MNEIKATIQNRVENKLLNLRIKEIERVEILSLSRANRYISLVRNDLQEVRASTGHTRLTKEKIKENSSRFSPPLDDTTYSDDSLDSDEFLSEPKTKNRPNTLSEFNKIKDEFNDAKTQFRPKSCQNYIISNHIEQLKKKDPIFRKRYSRFELTKLYGRIPIFNEYDNRIQVNMPKCVIEKKKKELIQLSSNHFNRMKKENEARTLNEKSGLGLFFGVLSNSDFPKMSSSESILLNKMEKSKPINGHTEIFFYYKRCTVFLLKLAGKNYGPFIIVNFEEISILIEKKLNRVLLRKTAYTFFQIYGVNVIYAFYGVNAHENNHVFFDVLFDVFCFSSKLLNEISHQTVHL
ncbi:hypothetical protein BpHYR1_008389 [Brachionus plicatilis]|uniref:Uncharacterized protein n=1 Tax=Brachionus plicatilis TaxID=10195 RepID=A0A3M7Q0B0_BRAPC|nr:hypothetical protein BpHYR1_008389 [Brachionus plicatilis]